MTSTVSDRVRNWAIGLRMTSKYPVHQLPPPPPRTREPAIPFCWTRLWRLGTTDSCAVLKPDSHLPARYMGEKCLSDSVCEWEQSLMCGPCLHTFIRGKSNMAVVPSMTNYLKPHRNVKVTVVSKITEIMSKNDSDVRNRQKRLQSDTDNFMQNAAAVFQIVRYV